MFRWIHYKYRIMFAAVMIHRRHLVAFLTQESCFQLDKISSEPCLKKHGLPMIGGTMIHMTLCLRWQTNGAKLFLQPPSMEGVVNTDFSFAARREKLAPRTSRWIMTTVCSSAVPYQSADGHMETTTSRNPFDLMLD